jgi:diadenosine tetraphosphate (Ap4A) HIT family hydrolase
MALIFETENFTVEAFDTPHVDRDEGGHIRIIPKTRFVNRQELSSEQAIKLMRLTIVVGEAMTKVMNEHGVDIGRINYHDSGNWAVFKPEGPYLHIHLYGRAKSAKVNKYGDAVIALHREKIPEHYANMKPLNEEDIRDIKLEIEKLLKQDKYQDSNWGLSQ